MKLKVQSTFDGHNTKRDGNQVLTFKVPLSELGEAVKTLLSIQRGITAGAILEDNTQIPLGRFLFESLRIDREGELTLKLASTVNTSGVDIETLRSMIDKTITLVMKFKRSDPDDDE